MEFVDGAQTKQAIVLSVRIRTSIIPGQHVYHIPRGGDQMRWDIYERKFRKLAEEQGSSLEKTEKWLAYAKTLSS